MTGTHIYRLKFEPTGDMPAPDIEFEAEDAFKALSLAHDKARHRSAELWRDGKRICNIRRVGGELWEIRGGSAH